MGAIEISGNLTAGDHCGVSSCGSSSGDLTIPLELGGCCSRPAAAIGGSQQRSVNSPGTYVPLPAVGPSGDVKQGDFLYLRSNAPLDVRITTDDGSGGTEVSERMTDYLLTTFPPPKPLELLEVRGVATIAYLVSGPS